MSAGVHDSPGNEKQRGHVSAGVATDLYSNESNMVILTRKIESAGQLYIYGVPF